MNYIICLLVMLCSTFPIFIIQDCTFTVFIWIICIGEIVSQFKEDFLS